MARMIVSESVLEGLIFNLCQNPRKSSDMNQCDCFQANVQGFRWGDFMNVVCQPKLCPHALIANTLWSMFRYQLLRAVNVHNIPVS